MTDKWANFKWGTFELESATGKNSACEGFGQKCVSENRTLAKYE